MPFPCNFASHHCKTFLQSCKSVSHHCIGRCTAAKWPRTTAKRFYSIAKRPRTIAKRFCSVVSCPCSGAGRNCTVISPTVTVSAALTGATSYYMGGLIVQQGASINVNITNSAVTDFKLQTTGSGTVRNLTFGGMVGFFANSGTARIITSDATRASIWMPAFFYLL